MISGSISGNLTSVFLLVIRLSLTLALYAFLAYAVRIIWQDLRKQTDTAAFAQVPPISLLPENSQKSTAFKLNEISLGRSPSCDLPIQDDTVSAHHARLYFRKNQWWVEDNESSNGSFLNDSPVTTPTVLTSGDQLKLGSFTIFISFSE
jgi:pSer/pThr/pTyr-binding forkhead associated (FHA) protein